MRGWTAVTVDRVVNAGRGVDRGGRRASWLGSTRNACRSTTADTAALPNATSSSPQAISPAVAVRRPSTAWLRDRRPLWDVVVVTLSLGGLAGVITSLVPAWRRVRNLSPR